MDTLDILFLGGLNKCSVKHFQFPFIYHKYAIPGKFFQTQ